jgi:4-hydroxy-2-oxoheptanedioate aldolase
MNKRRCLRERLALSGPLVGLVQTHPNPLLAELVGMCGYEFLLLDGEHGAFSDGDYPLTFQSLAATDAFAFVRLPGPDSSAIGRLLDMGADAIVIPHVSTAEEARELARAMSYPPTGTRSYGASAHRTTRYGMDTAAYSKTAREDVCLIVIIESARGVANAEAILAVPGVDGALVGASDLSADLGCVGDFSQPAYADALAQIERAAATTGKFLGAAAHAGHPFETLFTRGYRLVIAGVDMPLIREAMSAQLTKARSFMQSAS